MVLTKTPICNFGKKPHNFSLKGVDEKIYELNNCFGENGTLIMFICNHCPYVKAVIKDIVKDTNELKKYGISCIAIMSNDTKNYPEDSFENMKNFSRENKFSFPYLIDESQDIAKKFGAVCTPDFFGYNSSLELQYRGRIYELNNKVRPRVRVENSPNELLNAMKIISETGKGPESQTPSIGCSIKWSE